MYKRQEEAYARAIGQLGQEYTHAPQGWFDSFVNGMNRLPRPGMTIGVLGLFVYAMVDPGGFSLRMEGLNLVPEPLWWLLGAIVSFYFGAREAHYFRNRVVVESGGRRAVAKASADVSAGSAAQISDAAGEAALDAALAAAMAAPVEIAAVADADAAPAEQAAPAGWSVPADAFGDNAALRDWATAMRA